MINQAQIIALLQKSGTDITPAPEDFDKSFAEIGLDSLDVYNFFGEIEIELGKKISDEEFQNLHTLKDVIDFINS